MKFGLVLTKINSIELSPEVLDAIRKRRGEEASLTAEQRAKKILQKRRLARRKKV